MRVTRISFLAAGLTLLFMAGLAVSARCLSLWQVSCSVTSLFGKQAQLDVPYAGTRREVVAKMLELANVGPGDHVIDLGTGDGRIVIAAVRDRGARGVGVDLDEVLIQRAQHIAREEGVAGRAAFRIEDLFATPLGNATVVTMFLLPEVNLKLRPRILSEMQPGSRIVSHAFDMGKWRPDASERVGGSRVYLWIVPAQVEGLWRMTRANGSRAELTLRQEYQAVQGTLASGGAVAHILHSQLQGSRVRFVVDEGDGPLVYEGVIRGDVIQSLPHWDQAKIPHARGWHAERLAPANES